MKCLLLLACSIVAFAHPPIIIQEKPEWIRKYAAYYPNGSPKEMLCYEEKDEGLVPVLFYQYYPIGAVEKLVECIGAGEKTVPHGLAVRYYEEGSLAAYEHYHLGLPEGEAFTYFPKGEKLQTQGHYRGGKKEGTWLSFYENGQKECEQRFHADVPEGEMLTYYASGQKKEQAFFDNGLLEGTATEWYENGQVKAVRRFIHGKLQSQGSEPALMLYGDDGHLASIQDYQEGLAEGALVAYHPNGYEAYRLNYLHGQRHGKGVYSSKQGKVIGQEEFRNDIPCGKHWKNHENGKRAFEAEYDSAGHLIGTLRRFAENGTKIFEGKVEGDKCFGEVLEWYDSGHLAKIHRYNEAGELGGIQEDYFPNGQLRRQECYAKGVLEGMCVEWDDTGQILLDAHYQRGALSGPYKKYFLNGQLEIDCTFTTAGKLEGPIHFYYENGQLRSEGTAFPSDQSHGLVTHYDGLFVSYHPDGSLASRLFFRKGLPIGQQSYFYPGGETLKVSSTFDDDGKLHGEMQVFHPDGTLARSHHYHHGLLHGLKAAWDPQGGVVEESTYINGRLEGRFFIKHPDGKEEVFTYKDNRKEGPYIGYYPPDAEGNKKIAIEGSYKRGKREGPAIEYSPQGKKISAVTYVNDKKEGLAQVFDERGQILLEAHYKDDLLDGVQRQFFPTGKLFQETPYTAGKREGEENRYFETGALASRHHYHDDQLDGLSQNWNSQGILVFEAEYRNGKRDGKFCKYFDDGKPYIVQSFRDDQLDGLKQIFDLDGNVTESRYTAGQKDE